MPVRPVLEVTTGESCLENKVLFSGTAYYKRTFRELSSENNKCLCLLDRDMWLTLYFLYKKLEIIGQE